MLHFLGFLLFLYLGISALACTWLGVVKLAEACDDGKDHTFGGVVGVLVMGYLFFWWLIGY